MAAIMDFLSTLLALPFVPVILLVLFVILVAAIIGGLLKGIIRILFAPVRFLLCFAIVLLIIGFVAYSLFNHPILPTPEKNWEGEAIALHNEEIALEEVAERFKGVFNQELPLLAWRMYPEENQKGTAEGLYQLGAVQPVTIRIQYLPIGSMTVQYDPLTGKISILEGLGGGETDSFVSSFLKMFGEQTPTALAGEA